MKNCLSISTTCAALFCQDKNPTPLQTAALRLVLDIVPGLEQSVFQETDGLIKRLYHWSETAPEPMRSYSTGLLAVALELSEVASDPENR